MKTIKIGEQELVKVDLFAGMSYEEVLKFVFREDDYVSIVRWTETPACELAFPGFHTMSLGNRVKQLQKIIPWLVERKQFSNTNNRLYAKTQYLSHQK